MNRLEAIPSGRLDAVNVYSTGQCRLGLECHMPHPKMFCRCHVALNSHDLAQTKRGLCKWLGVLFSSFVCVIFLADKWCYKP